MDIQDKVVIMTGASAGIGLAAARLFTARGAKVALVARSGEVLQRLAEELPGSLAVPADLGEVERVPQVIQAVLDHYGRIDVLVNNAARAFHTPIEQADIDLFRKLLDLNVASVVRAMQCVVPAMRRQGGGVIVNVSSGLSKRVVAGTGPYASTKYALNALTLIAREELAGDGIRVGLVIPGMTPDTRLVENAVAYIRPQPARPSGGGAQMVTDTAQSVAEKILEAVQSEAAETYTRSTQGLRKT